VFSGRRGGLDRGDTSVEGRVMAVEMAGGNKAKLDENLPMVAWWSTRRQKEAALGTRGHCLRHLPSKEVKIR